MKKFIIITFVFVMMLSMSALASETRVHTMGDNNNVLLDDANIFLYPSRILDHPNLGIAEIGQFESNFGQVGINWKLDDQSVLGTYISTRNTDDRIDLFYGKDLNGNKLGVRLNFMQMSTEYENDPVFGNTELATNHIDLTVGLTEANGQWDVALNFGTGSFTNINNAGADVTEPDGINNIALYGRYFQVKNPNYTMIHHVAVMTEKNGVLDNGTSISTVEKTIGFDIGTGFNFTPSSHVLGVFDLGVKFEKLTTEVTGAIEDPTSKTFTLPYFKMGFDGEVFKWLDVRFGATSYWNNQKDEDGIVTFTKKYADNMTYFGLGFNFGHLHADLEANPRLFVEGPDFISGGGADGLGNDLGASMSVTYEF